MEFPEDLAGALRAALDAPHDAARALPGGYYRSGEMLAAERALFARTWICVGRADEIAAPGDYLTWQIGAEPIVVVRGADGVVRALSNVCRHRGMLLAEGHGTARRLICPYHAWTYDLGGQLIGAPRMEDRPGFRREDCRLPEFPVEIWRGFVFVSLDPEAAPLAPRLGGLDAMIGAYHFEEMTTRYAAVEVWETNWKSLVENFMEGYHLTPLHPRTLHPVNPTGLCAHFPAGEGYFGYTVGFSPDMARAPRGHPDLSAAERDTCVMFSVPPNLMVGGASDYSSYLCIEPLGVDRVRVRLGLFFYGEDWTEAEVARAAELFQETMAEDKTVLSRIGQGLASAHYRPGPLAPAAYEGCVLDLAKYVAGRVLPG